jgi:hypothetical protein
MMSVKENEIEKDPPNGRETRLTFSCSDKLENRKFLYFFYSVREKANVPYLGRVGLGRSP